MIILSIDASTKSSGWAVFDNDKLLEYGCYTASSTDLVKRIHKITDSFDELMNKYKIDKVVLEEVRPDNEYGQKNVQTHRALMWLQGAICIMVHDKHPAPVEYLYPSEWRSECGIQTGAGRKRESLKEKDIEFAKEKFNIDVNDDIADAIGLGYAYWRKNGGIIQW